MRKIVSIDIGSRNMHIVEGYFQKEEVTVTKAYTAVVPEECRKNEEVTDVPLLVGSLRGALQAGAFRSKEAIVTINATQAVVRDVDLPPGKPKELDGMIQQEMRHTFNVPEEDVIQYKLLNQLKGPEGETLNRYRVVCLNENLVRSYYDLLKGLKLKPIAMDVNLNAMQKLLNGSNNLSINDKIVGEEVVMLVDFGNRTTSVYIVAKDNEVFFRQLGFGSGEIEEIVTDELLTQPESVRLEKEAGECFFEGTEKGSVYYNALKPYFYRFNDELRKIIGFYNSRSGSANVSTIYIMGEGSGLAGLEEYWESNLGVHVEQLKSISKLSRQSKVEKIGPYLNAIGALIRY